MYLYVEYMMHVEAGGVLDIANDRSNRSDSIALRQARTVTKQLSTFKGNEHTSSVLLLTVFEGRSLFSCASIEGATLRGLSDPIVYLDIENPLLENDEQSQRTSLMLTTLNPKWNPPEVFQFLLYDVFVERISITVVSQCGLDKTHLGQCYFDAMSLEVGEERTETLALNRLDGEPAGEIVIGAIRLSIEEANIRSCYECL